MLTNAPSDASVETADDGAEDLHEIIVRKLQELRLELVRGELDGVGFVAMRDAQGVVVGGRHEGVAKGHTKGHWMV